MQKANKRQGAPVTRADTAQKILDAAERLVQTRGYNGFSYANIAAELSVTKASLHYHFVSKAALGCALIDRYHAAFAAALTAIDATVAQPRRKVAEYVELYDAVIRNDRMCLCGMLAAEHATLPPPMQVRLQQFFDANERWLASVLEQGRRASDIEFRESANERARGVLGALEGAMLVARSYGDARRFRSAADYLLADLCKASASPARAPAARARRARA